MQLIQILDKSVYQISYLKENDRVKKIKLVYAQTGNFRPHLSKEEDVITVRKKFRMMQKLCRLNT